MIEKGLLKNHYLFKKLASLKIPDSEYVIMGSGIMFAVGIRELETLDDLDLLVTSKGWDLVKNLTESHYDEEWKCNHLYLFNNEIEIYNGWGPGEYIAKELIQNSKSIDGYNFSNIEDVIRWKTERGLEKDTKHLMMIRKYLSESKSSNSP